jgi:RNA polymerase sigma-70 factor (ECF subfamily)
MAVSSVQNAGSIMSMEEYEKIFKQYYSELCIYAAKILGDSSHAEEIVQELFTNLWSKRYVLKIQKDIKNYLLQAVKNNCLMYFRDKKRKHYIESDLIQQPIDNDRSPAIQQLTVNEITHIIENTLQNVPERWRNIFTMIRFEGYKYREVADNLSISVKTVEKAMGQMLKMFRRSLHDYITLFLIMIELWQQ